MTKETRQVVCTSCGETMNLEMPPFQVINEEIVSMVVMVHPEAAKCQNCGQEFLFVISKLKNIEYGWKPVERAKPKNEDQDAASIIMPPKRVTLQ